MADDLRADLDELLLQTRQRPILDRLRRRQSAQEIAEIVGQRMKLAGIVTFAKYRRFLRRFGSERGTLSC
jgi:hypothetical protein